MSYTHSKETGHNEHQKIWNLLPWYVNETLGPAEREAVKLHIKTCIPCRIELGQQQQLFEKIQQTDLLQQASRVSYAQLKKKIKIQNGLESDKFRISDFVKYAALAASLLLLAMPLMLNNSIVEPAPDNTYRTLANPVENEPKKNIVRVVFASESDPDQIDRLVKSVTGHVVEGPSKNGIYKIQIDTRKTSRQAVDDAVSSLQNSPLVVFAELAR